MRERVGLGNGDILQKAQDGLVEEAMKKIDGPARHPSQTGNIQLDDGELVEGSEHVTFILQAPGYGDDDLCVLESKGAPGFVMKRNLPPDADLSNSERRYASGVLSVKTRKTH